METFLKDLKYALRMFAQSKTFTVTAVAALALGIGASRINPIDALRYE